MTDGWEVVCSQFHRHNRSCCNRARRDLSGNKPPFSPPSGIHAGADIPRPVPGKLPHDLKSRAPEGSEKPGQGTKERLRERGRDTSGSCRRPVTLNKHAQLAR